MEEYKSGSVELPGYGPLLKLESKDVYTLGTPAMVAVGISGKGKTVSAVDMAYSNIDVATHFMYMTDSYESPANAYLRSMVPEIYVKNQSFQVMCDVWGDTVERNLLFGRFTSPEIVNRFINNRAPSVLSLQSEIDLLQREVASNSQMFPQKEDLEAALRLKIANLKLKFIADTFHPNDPNLLPEESQIVRMARSTRPCPVYIFDDITATLNNPPKETIDIPFPKENGEIVTKQMKGADAINFLLMNMLTMSRQYGVIGFFVHSLAAFDRDIRSQFGAIMFVGKEGITEMAGQHAISREDKDLIKATFEVAEEYPFYKAVYFQNPSLTPHGQKVALFKPKYYRAPKPIGVETYRVGMQNVMNCIAEYGATSMLRSTIDSQKRSMEMTVEALAQEGRTQQSSSSTDMKAPTSSLDSLLG